MGLCGGDKKESAAAVQEAKRIKAVNAAFRRQHVGFSTAESLQNLGSSMNGLDPEQIEGLLAKHGPNKLASEPPRSFWDKLFDQVKDPLVVLLFIAAVVSFGIAIGTKAHTDEFIPPIFIILIVVANAALGIQQEGKAEDAVAALEKNKVTNVEVIRGGKRISEKVENIVPGDVILLEAGVVVSADCRVLDSNDLACEEAALTGESVPIKKFVTARAKSTKEHSRKSIVAAKKWVDTNVDSPDENKMRVSTLVADSKATKGDTITAGNEQDADEAENEGESSVVLYKSTVVASGMGKALVLTTGMNTCMGDISRLLNSVEDSDTPLQVRLKTLGKWLGIISCLMSLVVFTVGVATGNGTDPMSKQPRAIQMMLIAVSLTVAAVPEGLPVCVTIALSIGMKHMADKNSQCKNLKSVETLGSASIICSDKTGTLTKGEMTCVAFCSFTQQWPVKGTGYDPSTGSVEGNVEKEGKQVLAVSGLCNQATLELNSETKVWQAKGNLTDRALLTLYRKSGHEFAGTVVKENMFDSTRKMASTVFTFETAIFPGCTVALVKGAPNFLLDKCTQISIDGKVSALGAEQRAKIEKQVDDFSEKAYRVLAMAYTLNVSNTDAASVEQNLVYVGMCAIIDPPRDEVKPAIARCYGGGIQVRMITGDYLKTAEAIAKEIGLIEPDVPDQCLDCKVLRALDAEGQKSEQAKKTADAKIRELVLMTKVFARAKPEDKITIVTVLQAEGFICSMTGDGVNDAPALKKADIGVAMGITGTDAAQAAAAMVLTDDSFSSIVTAVEEGRRIYSNIRKFVYFLLSTNIAEVLVILLTSLIGMQSPLVPVQILWLNLMTDSLPALALCNEALEPRVMLEPPRPRDSNIIDRVMVTSILVHTFVLCTGELGTYIFALTHFTGTWNGIAEFNETSGFTFEKLCLHSNGSDRVVCDHESFSLQIRKAQTMVIYTIVFAELLRGYSCRSLHESIFTVGFFSNRWMQLSVVCSIGLTLGVGNIPKVQNIFGMEALDKVAWGWVFGFSVLPFTVDEILKFIYRITGYGDARIRSRDKISKVAPAELAVAPSQRN